MQFVKKNAASEPAPAGGGGVNGGNGSGGGGGTDTNNYSTNSAITIGISGSYGQFLGYIDEIRITKYARYTTNFTPATSSFLNQ